MANERFDCPISRKIEISERALSDLEEIWFYYSEVNENTAEKVLKQIAEKFQQLLEFPKIGKERNELLIGLRSFPTGKYTIFYQETGSGIEIVRVIYSSRDIGQIFDEMIPLEP